MQTVTVISLDLARSLRLAGLAWKPVQGDCFAVPDRDLDNQVFWLADMVVSRVDVPDGPPVLAFNGTTEWALDSLEVDEALWLPREDQLRERLGTAFASLARSEGPAGGWVVSLGDGSRHVDVSPSAAFARALLAHLARGH